MEQLISQISCHSLTYYKISDRFAGRYRWVALFKKTDARRAKYLPDNRDIGVALTLLSKM